MAKILYNVGSFCASSLGFLVSGTQSTHRVDLLSYRSTAVRPGHPTMVESD